MLGVSNLLVDAEFLLARGIGVVTEKPGLGKSYGLRSRVRSLGVVCTWDLHQSASFDQLRGSFDSSSERGSRSHPILSYASFTPLIVAHPVAASMSSVPSSALAILM
jgi:hypothetical protein